MGVIIINPNSSASMTEAMLNMARIAAPDLVFEGWTSHDGPASIQGPKDGVRATQPLLELVRHADQQNAQGIIIGCFDDTALAKAAELASCPVIGIGQASFHYAALRNWRFSVVTTLPVSVPVIERNIADFGLGSSLGRVRASDVPVLALENDREQSEQCVVDEAQRAVEEDDIDVVILGCAGMVNITFAVSQAVAASVIDPVMAGATGMKWLLQPVGATV